jgi:GT2 family glycosyltransferase
MKDESIAIVVLNWNGWKDTIELISTLFEVDCKDISCNIVLVDNGSTDFSVPKLLEWFSKNKIKAFLLKKDEALSCKTFSLDAYMNVRSNRKIIFILNENNYGYAGGMNIGIIFAKNCLKADYLMLLNNDTAVNKDFLLEMLALLKHPKIGEKIGIVGPKVLNYYTNDIVPIDQYIFPLPFASVFIKFFDNIAVTNKHYDTKKPLVVNRLDGSCFIVKTKIIEEVGILNEDFFTYWEDTDFFARVKKHGYFIFLAPKSVIRHKIGAVNMSLKKISSRASYYFGRNAIHFINLHYKGLAKLALLLIFVLNSIYMVSTYLFYYHDLNAARLFLLGVVKGFMKEKGKSSLLDFLLKQH